MMAIRKLLIIVFLGSLISACSGQSIKDDIVEKETSQKEEVKDTLIHPEGNTLETRFSPPGGFSRLEVEPNSFAAYLRELPLKPHGTQVAYYDGRLKSAAGVYVGVVDMDIGKRDLQQCADAVMRLRAEYLYRQKRYADIQFNFTNGFPADYSSWQQGKRIKVEGNKVYWYASKSPDASYRTFRSYLNMVFAYAGTLSLAKELHPIPLDELAIGDVFIQGGSPGHAIVIVDLAIHPKTGSKVFMLAQSYMPAQETQILLNPRNPKQTPWFDLAPESQLITPEWTFYPEDLKRF